MRSKVITALFRHRVIVTTKAGESFDGVLYSCDKTALVLCQASAIAVNGDKSNLPVDGEIIVLLANVAWMQRP